MLRNPPRSKESILAYKSSVVNAVNAHTIELSDLGKHPQGDLKIHEVIVTSFVIDLPWLFEVFPAWSNATVYCAHGMGKNPEHIQCMNSMEANVRRNNRGCTLHLHSPNVPNFGTVHSKMLLIRVSVAGHSFLRLVVTSANFVKSDWELKNQWIFATDIPDCESHVKNGSSDWDLAINKYFSAKFKTSPVRNDVLHLVESFDFSSIPSWISPVYSSPEHRGMEQLNQKPKNNDTRVFPCQSRSSNDMITMQSSSLGMINYKWLHKMRSYATGSPEEAGPINPRLFRLVLPSLRNVQHSWEGWEAADTLPIRKKTIVNTNIKDILQVWGGDSLDIRTAIGDGISPLGILKGVKLPVTGRRLGSSSHSEENENVSEDEKMQQLVFLWSCFILRNRAMPHMKTILSHQPWMPEKALPPRIDQIYAGSHNMSMAAWGKPNSNPFSYEFGITVRSPASHSNPSPGQDNGSLHVTFPLARAPLLIPGDWDHSGDQRTLLPLPFRLTDRDLTPTEAFFQEALPRDVPDILGNILI